MIVPLSAIRDSFEGVIPSVIATTDVRGVPNISYLSHVHYIDERRVALSNQFFSKTATNVRHSGIATLMVVDGRTGQHHLLDLRFLDSTTEGEFFERAAAHLSVMSLSSGMNDVMRLRSLEIFEVLECRPVVPAAPLAEPPCDAPFLDRLKAAGELCAEIAEEADTEGLLDRALAEVERLFGFANSVVLVPDEAGTKLNTIASRGYPAFGFGSEIVVGDGTAGMAAALRRPLRICDMRRGQRYVSAVQAEALRTGLAEIPFPSLPQPRSQLAVPLLGRGRLLGVLFVESEQAFAFGHSDEAALAIVASQLAMGLLLAERERIDMPPAPPALPTASSVASRQIPIRYYPFDGSIFLDGDYAIRGLPGRLLHYLLSNYAQTGRTEYSNRELRREPTLQLPDFKDNLETRLILLRRRLEERGGPVRLLRPERGRIQLSCDGVPMIEMVQRR